MITSSSGISPIILTPLMSSKNWLLTASKLLLENLVFYSHTIEMFSPGFLQLSNAF